MLLELALIQINVTFGGETRWLEKVTDAEYNGQQAGPCWPGVRYRLGCAAKNCHSVAVASMFCEETPKARFASASAGPAACLGGQR